MKFNTQEKMYHSFLRQRSKITWLCKGDENNAFFHAFLKKRRMENSIVSYTNDQGEVIDNFREVVDHFIKHFQNYMGSSSRPTQGLRKNCMEMGNHLNREQQLKLVKPFTSKEIKRLLVFSSKSPGPDGYGAGFFKKMWPEIGTEFTKAIESFFMTGFMPRELHATMITLIPKTENPTRAVEYRPIAFCSTIYKCISKLLCSRLSQVLPGIVNQNQGAFVQGRSIAHNVMILQDLLKNYKRKNISPRCTIKVDISKAYDTVNWEFLENLLNEFKLPGRFISWVMTCLKSTSYSILMNGRVQGSFQGKKGLRQGDLASIQGDVKKAIMTELALQEGDYPLKYLGVPLRPTKWKAEDCSVIIKKIKQRLHTWATRHLSFAGRAQLIHSVLLGLRNYWMSIFILPYSVTREVKKLCRGFLWGWNGSRSKLHVASWEKVCLPKNYGGLGFKDGIKWNQAILAKYVWAISSKRDILWVRWVNTIYLKSKNWWEYELKSDTSWYWRKLCHLRDKFTQEDICKAGAGTKFKPAMLYNSSIPQTLFEYSKHIWCSINILETWSLYFGKLLTLNCYLVISLSSFTSSLTIFFARFVRMFQKAMPTCSLTAVFHSRW
uniref:Reverse transcriptase domain-containing protein n=1 Tax=Cannabis sativa TaxID=3483 RepID=A0A803P8U7_CANSA